MSTKVQLGHLNVSFKTIIALVFLKFSKFDWPNSFNLNALWTKSMADFMGIHCAALCDVYNMKHNYSFKFLP